MTPTFERARNPTRKSVMSNGARSVYVFGIYLIVLGSILVGSPNTLLAIFGLPAATDPWIRVLGVTVMAIGMLDAASARTEQTGFFRATVWVRVFVVISFVALTLLGITPRTLLLFGLVDLAGAAWTFASLRKTAVQAGVV
jgi:hypothetical protein